MENEIFERDYRKQPQEEESVIAAKKSAIWNYAVENGFFKSYSDAMKKIPKYIVQEDKKAYEDLLSRLDAYAKRKDGNIKGIVDYDKWESHIIVELPFFEACTAEEFCLLSDMAKKANNVTFEASDNGGIRLSVMINNFDEIEDTEHVLDECIIKDDKLVEMLTDHHNMERDVALSNPMIIEFLEKIGVETGMTAEEVYDWIDELYHSDPEAFLSMLSEDFPDDENKDTE